ELPTDTSARRAEGALSELKTLGLARVAWASARLDARGEPLLTAAAAEFLRKQREANS
ncbi:unnamed protein product, partial [Effrenium voratum]